MGKAIIIVVLSALFAVQWPCLAQKTRREDMIWQTRETLISRLGAELYKIDILRRDLSSIRIILNDMRNLELFPPEVTDLNDIQIVAFDKRIEHLENRARTLGNKVEGFRMPLSDALSILRELIVGQPVEDMFEIIEKGDIQRIDQMLDIKHSIDDLWKDLDLLLTESKKEMGFSSGHHDDETEEDDEFFQILKANLGRQWESFYNHMESIKDSLAVRATPSQAERMFTYEYHHLKQVIASQNYRLAQSKLSNMRRRYPEINPDKLAVLSANLYYQLGEYSKIHDILDNAASLKSLPGEASILRIKSLYALEEYQNIWNLRNTIDYESLSGTTKNILLWLIMESGLHIGVEEDFSSLAKHVNKESEYKFHVFHALARSYIQKENYPIALSVLNSAVRYKVQSEVDIHAYRRIRLAIGQTQYEIGDYKTALKTFFDLINEPQIFDEVLFGIVWCYIKMDMYDKAETSLRKIISQESQSPFAVESILLMAKRFVNKALYEWEKTCHLEKEEYRISLTLEKLKSKSNKEKNSNDEKIKSAIHQLQSLLMEIREGNRYDKSDIESLFQKAQNICGIVTRFYETGSFQEKSFSDKREKMLHTLDSLLAAVKNDERSDSLTYVYSRERIHLIKQLVRRGHVMASEIAIEEFRWKKDYLDHRKERLIDEKNLFQLRKKAAKKEDIVKALSKFDIQIDSVVSSERVLLPQWQEQLMQTIATTLERVPLDTLEDIYFRYHLGELYYSKENRVFAQQYETYEKQYMKYDSLLLLFHDGKLERMPQAPQKPILDHSKSIAVFQDILNKYPGNTNNAPVEYSLAWCYNDLEKLDSAVFHMSQLTKNYPNSPYTPQAWMYTGEYYFDHSRLDSATHAYRSVMNYPESKWFDEALYKLAWTNYRLSNPEKAISSFLALIDTEGAGNTGKPLLEKESIDYIAISFSESDPTGDKGLKRAERFVVKYGDDMRGPQILFRLAEVYREQGRYSMAKRTYKSLLSMYPQDSRNHLVENGLLVVSERDMTITQTAEAKVEFFKKYNHGGMWSKAQNQSQVVNVADSMAAAQLYDAAILFHQLALQENDSIIYARAAQTYELFIQYYPDLPKANECHYNFAEILFSMGNYSRAAREYMAVSKRYPNGKYRETAAWNAIVSSQLLMKQEEERQ